MNRLFLKYFLLALLFAPTAIYANSLQTECSIKAANIQKEIKYAKAYGNTHRVAGLEKALSEVKEHCNDQNLHKKGNRKVADKQKKVMERKAELEKAQTKGNVKKIAKQKKKLAQAEQELKEAKFHSR